MTHRRKVDRVPESTHRESIRSQRPAEVPAVSRRYISLRWELTASYHESWPEAEEALVRLPASQRAGIVDSQTGRILASQASYPAVQAAVSDEVIGMTWRDGPLGDLAGERRRAAFLQRRNLENTARSRRSNTE